MNRNLFIKIAVVVLSLILLLLFSGLDDTINNTSGTLFSLTRGELEPDTNIVLIHITENDLSGLGPWPIKRSYYALLINKLESEKVKRIGLEIFLSARLITQTIYDVTLKNEIEKAGNVVISSVAGSISKKDSSFVTDSLSFPSPKLLDPEIKTGAINFIRDNGIIIPAGIRYGDTFEKSFSVVLFDSAFTRSEFKVNFISSWKKFRNYSLLEFFNKSLKGSKGSLHLKNKIVLIGLSDMQIASSFSSAYDEKIPGIALHAFALDNLLNKRYIKEDFKIFSAVLLVLILLLTVYISNKRSTGRILYYSIIFSICIITSFFFYSVFFQQLAVSFFVVPIILLFITELILMTFENTNLLRGIISQREALQHLLIKKETELISLKTEFENADTQNSVNLKRRIAELESDINRLKKDEEDELASVQPSEYEVKNFQGIVYRSKQVDELIKLIQKSAPTNTTILITGESGTGKELAAKAIHSLSERSNKPFVAINCAALTDSLLESELFGHTKGAFTGASQDKKGKFEAADTGTIFLDEIGETSENFQVKLLRVLQSGDIEKVGSTDQHKVNVRVIAATNKDIEKEVREKRFREDLFYRLNVFRIDIPSLRKRAEDIEVLANDFIQKENPDMKLSRAVVKILTEYSWNGNVRELEAVIKRAAIFASSESRLLVQVSDLPKEMVKVYKYNFEDIVLESLRNKDFSHSSISETAKELGNVNRTLISENFRGIVFKTLADNNFDLNNSVKIISGSDSDKIQERVKNKIQTFISNLKTDLTKINTKDFVDIKQQFASKYKNLPVKFHIYLDELIKHLID